MSGALSYLVVSRSSAEVVGRPACHFQSSGVTVSHFQSVLRWRPGLASGRPASRALRHHMKCSSSVGVGGPSCTARGAGVRSPSPRPGDRRSASQPWSLPLSRTRPPHQRRGVDRALVGRRISSRAQRRDRLLSALETRALVAKQESTQTLTGVRRRPLMRGSASRLGMEETGMRRIAFVLVGLVIALAGCGSDDES